MATILIVEDDSAMLETIKDILEMGGYHCDSAENTTDALDLLMKNDYDAIVSDIGLPERFGRMSNMEYGFEFMRSVKGSRRLAHIPIIAETGYSEDEIWDKAKSAGASVVILKTKILDDLVPTLVSLGIKA